MINLTQQERDKFALWLEQEAESDKIMLEQIKKLPGQAKFGVRFEQRIMAYLIVSALLKSTEDFSIGG